MSDELRAKWIYVKDRLPKSSGYFVKVKLVMEN